MAAKCPKLLSWVIPESQAVDLQCYSAGVAHSFVYFLYHGEYLYPNPPDVLVNQESSRTGFMARLVACCLAKALEYGSFEDFATKALLSGAMNIGAPHVLDIVRATWPPEIPEHPPFKPILDELAKDPIVVQDHSSEGWLTKARRPDVPVDDQSLKIMYRHWVGKLKNGYWEAFWRYFS